MLVYFRYPDGSEEFKPFLNILNYPMVGDEVDGFVVTSVVNNLARIVIVLGFK